MRTKKEKNRTRARTDYKAMFKRFMDRSFGKGLNEMIKNGKEAIGDHKMGNRDISEASEAVFTTAGNGENMVMRELVGVFLSIMINKSTESMISIEIPEGFKPDFFGINNTKNIRVFGSVGDRVGMWQKSGSIFIYGDAGDCAGNEMEGGSICITGRSGKLTGAGMRGGIIEIGKGTGSRTGIRMRGGIIEIVGNAIMPIGVGATGGEIKILGSVVGKELSFQESKF